MHELDTHMNFMIYGITYIIEFCSHNANTKSVIMSLFVDSDLYYFEFCTWVATMWECAAVCLLSLEEGRREEGEEEKRKEGEEERRKEGEEERIDKYTKWKKCKEEERARASVRSERVRERKREN